MTVEPSSDPVAAHLLRSCRDPAPSARSEGIGVLRVVAWDDPPGPVVGTEPTADPRGWYAEHVWLPVLGPTAAWLLRRLSDVLDLHPDGVVLALDALGRALGVGGTSGRHAVLDRAILRCCRYGVARLPRAGELAVRRRLPPVPARQVLRLHPDVQALHRRWMDTPPTDQPPEQARRAALAVAAVAGPDGAAIEHELHRLGFHPALAHNAAEWAAGIGPVSSVPRGGRELVVVPDYGVRATTSP